MVYGLNYLHQRNVDDQQIASFGLGYFYNNQLYGVSSSPTFEKLCQFMRKLFEEKIDLSIYDNCILIPDSHSCLILHYLFQSVLCLRTYLRHR